MIHKFKFEEYLPNKKGDTTRFINKSVSFYIQSIENQKKIDFFISHWRGSFFS